MLLAPRPFRLQAKPCGGTFKLVTKPRQVFYSPMPRKRVISIKDLIPDVDYACTRLFSYGYVTITCSGEKLRRSWREACRKGKPEDFVAAFWKVPSGVKQLHSHVFGRWRVVLLHPREDLYFAVQPVHPDHYG